MAAVDDIVAQLTAPRPAGLTMGDLLADARQRLATQPERLPLPDVGEPLIGDGGQLSAGSPWANRAADIASRVPGHMLGQLATLPQRAFESSEALRRGEGYDPGPVLEAAMLPMGTGAIAGVPVRGGEAVLGSGFTAPLYHGSPKAGLKEILPSERGALGPGAYFTPADNVAARYGENVYQLPEKQRNIFNGLGDRYGSYEDWKADKARLMAAVEPEKQAELQGILDKMWTNDGYPMHSRIASMYRDEGKAQDLYRRAGFEGIAGHADGPEVNLFDPQPLAVQKVIRAYHGSPHDFDKFSLDKIGTGEGAQAYGHGLYFAENEGVAKSYRDVLADRQNLSNASSGLDAEAYKAVHAHGSVEAAKAAIDAEMKQWANSPRALEQLRALKDAIREPNPGHMYEVNINADPEHFLDWDKPLSEQPHVYDKLSHLPQFQRQQAMIDSDRLVAAAKENGIPPLVAIKTQSELAKGTPLPEAIAKVKTLSQNPEWAAHADKLQSLVGDKAVTMRTVLPQEWTGSSIAQNVAGMRPAEIATTLRDAGIPGIKYLDQGSRMPTSDFTVWAPRIGENEQQFVVRGPGNVTHGKFNTREEANAFADQENAKLNPRTHNYVVFDDKLIDIARKYGMGSLAALPPAVLATLGSQSGDNSQ